MSDRVEFNFYMGLDGPQPSFETAVIEEASRLVGGCTVTFNEGYWIEGAEHAQSRYAGHLISERCFHLQFSVVPIRKLEINYIMRCCIRQEALKHGLDIGWVHVTTHTINAHHFQIQPGVTNAKRYTDTRRLSDEA